MKAGLNPETHIAPFEKVSYYDGTEGYIAWRLGTGNNIELLHVQSNEPGGGKKVLRIMLQRLLVSPPHCTVFGFCRSGNTKAHNWYRRMGFDLSSVRGIYSEGSAVVFSATFEQLRNMHLE